MSEIDIAFKKTGILVKDFQSNDPHYKSAKYTEAQARKDFIDKFWISLGWDVNHERQTNPYEQEVKVERGVAMGGSQRRADYAFYLAPNFHDVRFFVEAKKPFVEIETKENYFQLIRYGWNSGTPLAVLTDFEQFHVLDCRCRPDLDTALNRSIARYRYTDYIIQEKFSEIYWLFSREAVSGGSLEKCAKELPKPRGKAAKLSLAPVGYQSIDESFLSELDEDRNSLAHSFKNRNPDLDSETLTELAQRTLDRLVFLRFLEDKGIEPERIIERFGKKGTVWEDFISASRRLNGIYNGIVYKRHDILDCEKFRVDENAFAGICESLAHINSPYDFNAIPIHILGSIYERFLGKVIVATDKRAKVEEKPEVRKAGGVYYTPEYIVRYIVGNTVGKLIAGKTPDQIAEMRFADIACGSGSFLLGVFDLLLNYHGHYYNDHPGKARKGDCIKRDGKLFLSLHKKREILLNNIYGVDIDAQAGEVCQLSLYLKLLQEETESSAHQYILDFEHEARMKRLLPDLSRNIRCGNSLIGTDILEGQLFASNEERKLNPMNFEDAFPEVMKRGGFDAIVGNPPYVLGRETFDSQAKQYLSSHYGAFGGKYDLYIYFTERAISLLRKQARLGYILPNTLLANENAIHLRKIILDKTRIEAIKTFESRVFKNAQVESIVLIVKNEPSDPTVMVCIEADKTSLIPQLLFKNSKDYRFNIYLDIATDSLVRRVESQSTPLGRLTDICIGIQLGGSSGKDKKESFLSKKRLGGTYKRVLDGRDINRYEENWSGTYVHYGDWLHRKRDEKYFLNPKIVIRQIGMTPIASYDDDNFYTLNTIYNLINLSNYSIKFLLCIVNSNLGRWFWLKKNYDYKTIFPKIKKSQIEAIPIRTLNLADTADKSRHDEMVAKVEAMLEAKKQWAKAKTDKDKTYYEAKCAGLDRQIDGLVYNLYGLTEEEIKIVEGG